jgi:hypothetical protein
MEKDAHSRVNEAVPSPEAAADLSEDQKRALELGGQIEHSQGMQRERVAEQAEELGGK